MEWVYALLNLINFFQVYLDVRNSITPSTPICLVFHISDLIFFKLKPRKLCQISDKFNYIVILYSFIVIFNKDESKQNDRLGEIYFIYNFAVIQSHTLSMQFFFHKYEYTMYYIIIIAYSRVIVLKIFVRICIVLK